MIKRACFCSAQAKKSQLESYLKKGRNKQSFSHIRCHFLPIDFEIMGK